MNKIKNIVECGLFQGWAKSNIILQIMFEIANEEELELLCLWCTENDLLELKSKAENLYNKYKEGYYK